MLKEFVDKTALNNFDLFQSRLKKSDMLQKRLLQQDQLGCVAFVVQNRSMYLDNIF